MQSLYVMKVKTSILQLPTGKEFEDCCEKVVFCTLYQVLVLQDMYRGEGIICPLEDFVLPFL